MKALSQKYFFILLFFSVLKGCGCGEVKNTVGLTGGKPTTNTHSSTLTGLQGSTEGTTSSATPTPAGSTPGTFPSAPPRSGGFNTSTFSVSKIIDIA